VGFVGVGGYVGGMSRALVCDHCGTVLPLNARGEADSGEDSGWLKVTTLNESHDVCTRACLHEFIDRPEFVEAHEAWQQVIAEIVQVINEGRDEDD